jgi:undecaprenyl-diphosphatase
VDQANHWWLVVAAVAGAATFPADAASYMGATRAPIPFARTTLIQLASAFTSRSTPFGVGGIGLNMVYLERQSGDRAEAVGSVALNQGAGALVHAVLFLIAVAILGTGGLIGKVKLPTGWPVLVVVVAVLVAVGLAFGSRFGRERLVEPGRRVARGLADVARHPARVIALLAGSAGVTVFNGLALAASLAAFAHHVPLVSVLAVYTAGAAVASAAPTPGNLGAVEAALAAGLTGIGIASAPAVAAVLAFRLLTFWLPILPGLAALRYLQHRRLV